MTSKIILMMPKNQELSKFQRTRSQKVSRIKSQRIKIQEQLSFKNQDSRFKNQVSRIKFQELSSFKIQSSFKNQDSRTIKIKI